VALRVQRVHPARPKTPVRAPAERAIEALTVLVAHASDLLRPFAFRVSAGVAAGVGLLAVAVWGLAAHEYFWPQWILIPACFLLAVQAWLVFVVPGRRRWPLTRPLLGQLGISAALWLALVGVWAVTTRAYFWPAWVLLGLLAAAGLHLLVEVLAPRRRHDLAERVRVLTVTRAAAVEEQETRLRRIERDLHDGAQARLVALGMTLALAEQRFGDDPAAAHRLVSEARSDARVALEELRDLSRGIHPPLLTDRGLGPRSRRSRPPRRCTQTSSVGSTGVPSRPSRRRPISSSQRRSRTPPSTAGRRRSRSPK
jgi:signal transduction histidine kinase